MNIISLDDPDHPVDNFEIDQEKFKAILDV